MVHRSRVYRDRIIEDNGNCARGTCKSSWQYLDSRAFSHRVSPPSASRSDLQQAKALQQAKTLLQAKTMKDRNESAAHGLASGRAAVSRRHLLSGSAAM